MGAALLRGHRDHLGRERRAIDAVNHGNATARTFTPKGKTRPVKLRDPLKNVALAYVRKSLVRSKSDEISPERQRSNLARAGFDRGLDCEFYEDVTGHSSGRTEKRQGWQLLKAQLDRAEVAAVIVESLSRATRSVKDLFNFLAELEAREIVLISLKESIDTSTAMGRAFVGFIAVLNQFESDVASERAGMNIEFLQQVKGRHWGGTPFGCKRGAEDRQLVPSDEGIFWIGGDLIVGQVNLPPVAAAVPYQWRGYHDALRRCYEMYGENRSGYDRLNDALNAEGFRTRGRRGMPRLFNSDDVRRMIEMHRIYAGFTVLGRSKDGITATVKGSHDAILPVELCELVAEVKTARHDLNRGGGGRRKYVYLFTNLYCADCKSHLSGQFQRGKRLYRHYDPATPCESKKRSFEADGIEIELWQRFEALRSPEEFKERARARLRQMLERTSPRGFKHAERGLKQLEASLARLDELYVQMRYTREQYLSKREKLTQEYNAAENHLQRVAPDLKKVERNLERLGHFAAILECGTPAQQREAIDALIERAEESDGKLGEIVFREWARDLLLA